VGHRTVNRWVEWYRKGHANTKGERDTPPGLEALKPLPRADRGQTRVLDPALVDRAARLRAEEPGRSAATLVEMLRQEAVARQEEPPAIGEATLAYHLRARGATRRDLKGEGRAFPRYEHPYRNAVWQGDWTQGLPLPDPTNPGKTRLCHLHAFLDDHSRYVVHGEFYFRQNLPCLEDCFRKAVLKGGIPERTYWDNGAVYQARQIQLVAARLGTQVIFATPYAPEGKGKIERWFRTCKETFYPEARRADLKTLEELNAFFWAWLDTVYHAREHSELGQSPRARWEAGQSGVRVPDPASLVDLFLWEEKRQVDKAGCFHLAGNPYPAGEHLVGRQVTVRFDPFDMTRVRLYVNGGFVETVEPLTLTSRTFRKALPRRKEKPAPLESSVAYRKQLSRGYRREVEATLAQARPPEANGCLTRPELAALLCQVLGGRSLTVAEAASLADFFTRYAPLRADRTRAALLRAVEEKGATRHLRFYLDAVRDSRLERREG
jgi:transposase InsO family protein